MKVCHVIDEFTRQHLAFRVERRMGAADVIEMLDLAVVAHGAPQVLRADNGPEFIAGHVGHIHHHFAPDMTCSCGCKGHIESFCSGSGITAWYDSPRSRMFP